MPDGTNQLNDNALTSSIVSQGQGYSHGAMEARLARDAWRIDGREADRDLDVSHARSEEVRDLLSAASKAEVATEKIGAAGVVATHLAGQNTVERVNQTAFSLGLQAGLIDIRRDMQVGFNQTRTDNIQFANQARTDAIQFQAATNLAIEKTSAAGVLLATQNHAAQLAALAKCCCELEGLIRSENGQTRDLINATTLQGVRDQLADAKNQNGLLQILAKKL